MLDITVACTSTALRRIFYVMLRVLIYGHPLLSETSPYREIVFAGQTLSSHENECIAISHEGN